MNALVTRILRVAHIVKLIFHILGNLKMENENLNNESHGDDATVLANGGEATSTPASVTNAEPSDVAHTIEGGLKEAGVKISATAQGYVDFAMKILDFIGHELPAKDTAEYQDFENIIEEMAEGLVKTEDAGLRLAAWVKAL